MFLVESYSIAVLFCFVTMLCWGSWANTQKLAGKTWRYELFYWDYVLGVFLLSLIFALTMGNNGEYGRGFFDDLNQAEGIHLFSAFMGGVVFNIANILLVAAIAIAGMSVAFPVGIGLALVLGVLLNYIAKPEGNPALIFTGITLVTAAIIINAVAYRKIQGQQKGVSAKGLILSVLCGVLMSLFYYFVASSLAGVVLTDGNSIVPLTVENLQKGTLETGKMTPYTANFIFALGILLSNFIVNTAVMKKPFVGTPVPFGDYFKGGIRDHLWGIIGGGIWAVGMTLNVIASGVASPAVAYGLGQGATLVSAVWGVFIWQEFRTAPKETNKLLSAMFLFFIVGLGLLIWAKL
jgi:glucose uptake protein